MEETNCDELSTCYPTMETAIISPVTRRSTLRTNTIMLNLIKAFSPQRRDVDVMKYAWCDGTLSVILCQQQQHREIDGAYGR